MEAYSEKKFLLLKQKLDSLRYCQPLEIGSAALVEKLLNDLIKNTEGFQNLKRQNADALQKVIAAEQGLEPLKKENQRLVHENNQLHKNAIVVKENAEFSNERWKTTFNSLDQEKSDLKFALEQKEDRIRKILEENASLKSKLDTFMSKVYIPSSQVGLDALPSSYVNANASSVTNTALPKKGHQFELNKPLNEDGGDVADLNQGNNVKEWADQVRLQDQRIQELTRELRGFEENKALLSEKVRFLETKVQNREAEISRLESKFEVGGVNVDKLSKEYELNQQVEKVNRLNHQIDFLTKENHRMESELTTVKTDMKRIAIIKEESRAQSDKVAQLSEKLYEAQNVILQNDNRLRLLTEKHQKELMNAQERSGDVQQQVKVVEKKTRSLEDEILRLSEENEILREQATKADGLVNAYQSDKRAFSESVDKARQEKEGVLGKMQKYVEELIEKQTKIEEGEAAMVALNNRMVSIQRELELTNLNQSRLVGENSLLNDEISKLKANLREFERENLSLNEQRNDARIECERLAKKKEIAEEQAERVKNESYKIKLDVDSGSVAKDRMERIQESLNKENSLLKQDIQNLESILASSKANGLEAEMKNREQFVQIKALQDHVKEMERQIKLTTDIVDQKAKELRQSESARSTTEREVASLTALKKNYDDLLAKNQVLSRQIGEAEERRLKAVREADELKFEVMDKEELVKRLEEENLAEKEERARLTQELSEISTETHSIHQTIQRSKDRESEYSHVGEELEKARERERKQIIEIMSLQGEIRKMDQLIASGSRQVENLNNQKDEYLKEIKELRREMLNTRSEKESGTTQGIQLQEVINKQEILIQDLKDAALKDERRIKSFDNEIKVLTNEAVNDRARIAELDAANKQLKTLAEGLERIREELLQRLQSRNSERVNEEASSVAKQKEISVLSERLTNAVEELQRAKQSIVSVDAERDEIQNLLDAQTEENLKIKADLEQYKADLEKVRDMRNELNSKSESSVQRVIALESQCKDANKKISQLLGELENAKYTVVVKDKEIVDLANDLNVVTRQNQNLTEELVKAAGDRDEFRHQLNAVMIEEKKGKQGMRAFELEKQDLLAQYKEVCMDNEKLERQSQDLLSENQMLFRRAQELEKDCATLQGHLQLSENNGAAMLADIASMERQMTLLNQKLEQADSHIRDVSMEKDSIHRQYESMMRVSHGLEGNQNELQRAIMLLENEKISLIENLTSVKRELEVKTTQVEYDRSRAAQLEDVLMRERQAQHKQAQEFQFVQQEKNHLHRQIEELKTDNQNLQGYLKESNSSSSSRFNASEKDQRVVAMLEKKLEEKTAAIQALHTEQRELREENSKLRLNMFRFESEKNDLERRMSISKESYSQDDSVKSGGSSADQRFTNAAGWDNLRVESNNLKKSLQDANTKSNVLSQNVKNLRNEYDQVLPPSSVKSQRSAN